MNTTIYETGTACSRGCCVSFKDAEMDPWEHANELGLSTLNYIRPMYEVIRDHGPTCDRTFGGCWLCRPGMHFSDDYERLAFEISEAPLYL